MSRLVLVPVSVKAAKRFVECHHRHHAPPSNHRFAVGVAVEGELEIRGVAIVSDPVSRMLNDGWTAEVTRVATDGTKNACSCLYGAAWRACKALGYKRLVTYTLPEEGGASLRASGWQEVGKCGGGSWSRRNRPRVDMHPTQKKIRWQVQA